MDAVNRQIVALAILVVAFTPAAGAQERALDIRSGGSPASTLDRQAREAPVRVCDMPYYIVAFAVDSAVLRDDLYDEFESVAVDLSIRLQAFPECYVLIVGHSAVDEVAGISAQRTHVVMQQFITLAGRHSRPIGSGRIEERAMGPRCGRAAERAHHVDVYIVPGTWHPDDALDEVCPRVD